MVDSFSEVTSCKEQATPQYRVSGKARSLWLATLPDDISFPQLTGDISVDVAVVGGGVAGINSALFLQEAGLNVTLLEARRVVRGISGHGAGKITSQHQLIYRYLITVLGRERAQQYADANQTAIEKIAAFVKGKNIPCDFVRKPAYTFAETDEALDMVRKEVEAAQSLGLPASLAGKVPLPFYTSGAVRFDNQAQFHPGKYLLGLVESLVRGGAQVFENTRALDIAEGAPCTVTTDRGMITAKYVIITTHFPFYDMPGLYYTRLTPMYIYMLGIRTKEPFPDGIFIGAEETSYSFRAQKDEYGEIVLVGGEDHEAGQDDPVARYRALEENVRKIYDAPVIEYHWSGQYNKTPDRVPYIGNLTPQHRHIFVATGFGGWGMTNGTAAGMLLSDLILERSNPWAHVYDPARFDITHSRQVVVPVKPVAVPVATSTPTCSLASRPVHASPLPMLARGEGRILEAAGQQVAVYLGDDGTVYTLDPVCPHMGCILRWNSAEKTWDCPCHAARFNYDGGIIYGPALRDMAKNEIPVGLDVMSPRPG